MNRYLIISLVLLGWTAGAVLYGEHRVQGKWDLDKARQQTIAAMSRETDEAAHKAIAEQFKKDIEDAKSKAGHDAINRFIRVHGLLPDGTPVSGSGGGKTDCTGKPDATTGESGTSQHIEEFAQACALDALKVLNWQAWAIREGLEVK